MIGHAVFDLDGTLIDSVPLCADILNGMLADRGLPHRITLQAARPFVTAGGRPMVEALLGERCGDPGQALAEFRDRYAARPTPSGCLYPGVLAGLTALRASGVVLSIVSNKPRHLCDKVVAELGLGDLFGAVVGTSPSTPLKPDPAGLDLALAQSGGRRLLCCFVGDSRGDRDLARSAAIALIYVTYGYGDAAVDGPEALLADSFAVVPQIVLDVLRKIGA